jgi:hypothetical protein
MSNNGLVFEMLFLGVRAAKRAMKGADPWSRLIQGFRAVPTDQPGLYTCPRDARLPTPSQTRSLSQHDAKGTISLLDRCRDCLHPTIDRLVLCTFQGRTPPKHEGGLPGRARGRAYTGNAPTPFHASGPDVLFSALQKRPKTPQNPSLTVTHWPPSS